MKGKRQYRHNLLIGESALADRLLAVEEPTFRETNSPKIQLRSRWHRFHRRNTYRQMIGGKNWELSRLRIHIGEEVAGTRLGGEK